MIFFLKTVLNVLFQVGGALAFLLEDCYIVHCDIKLSNILVFAFPDSNRRCISEFTCRSIENGEGVLVKLADLGTASSIGPEGFCKLQNTMHQKISYI